MFIFDLLMDNRSLTPQVLNSCLQQLLASRDVLKLGFGLDGDLQKLVRSRPDLQGIKRTETILDLPDVWPVWLRQRPPDHPVGICIFIL